MSGDALEPHVLREYALLADGERGALVGPRGEIVWMCAPRWDSGSVFGTLLGAPGHYTVTPVERFVWGGYYESGSLIWRSRWTTVYGSIECREALALPGDPSRLVLLRQVLGGTSGCRVRVTLDPRADYGAAGLTDLHRDDGGGWTGRVGGLYLRWTGADDATVCEDGAGAPSLELELAVPAGHGHDLVLELSGTPLADRPVDPDVAWRETESCWRRSVPHGHGLTAPRDAAHAAAVLRGLTSGGGGMVAAATTSLPERFAAGENYDYRYVWVRDQCYAGRAAAAAGLDDLLDDAVRFLGARLLDDGPDMAPAYTVAGGSVPDERRLDVPGYPGGGDRIGNRGGAQFQLDAFGEMLLLLATAAEHGRLDAGGVRAMQTAVDAIERRWTEPDAGVWELDYREWAHSRLVCVAGLRAAATAHADRTTAGRAARWESLADAILARTASTSTHPDGRWQRAPDDPRPDGALLLPAVRGAVPASDVRSRATLHAYLTDLVSDGYAYRFRHDERPLGDAEGAFLLCNFFAVLACHQQGDDLTARHLFERARSACGPPGLFSEEFDVDQRQLRGNLPQAFVHALLLECSATLAPLESEKDQMAAADRGRPGGAE